MTPDDLHPPPSYAEATQSNAIAHLPSEYAQVEQYIRMSVGIFRGRIRKLWAADSDGLFKFEIAGDYRHCDNIQGRHRHSTIYFMVDPIKKIYYQMCHHPKCTGFRSIPRRILIVQ